MNIRVSLVAIVACFVVNLAVAGDMVVIVNKDNDSPIDKTFVAKVYLGESKSWPGGGAITAYDLAEDNPVRASFSTEVMSKSVSNMKALWAQNLFSGKAVPPKQLTTDDDVKKAVSGNKNAIGYIKTSSVDATVKVGLK